MDITFEGHIDRYNGVTVDSTEEPCEPEQLLSRLSDSLKKWKDSNKRCIWFKVNIKDAIWVPQLANWKVIKWLARTIIQSATCDQQKIIYLHLTLYVMFLNNCEPIFSLIASVKEGFNFHHARDDFVMMYKWLPEIKSNLPPSCHTNLGVGGIVLNENNQLLVVIEQHTEKQHWKLPGGYVERGEDLSDAAVREVKEETGIDAIFQSMVTFRHSHHSMFGNSDIYAVVMLKAMSDSISKSDIEIAACKWMDIDEFLSHPNVIEFNKTIVRQAMDLYDRKLKLDLVKGSINWANIKRNYTSLVLNDI